MRPDRPLLLLLASLSVCGCARQAKSDAPRVAAAASTRAQEELRGLEERWELAGEAGRKELRPELEDFLLRHPSDPSGARARLMLARVALAERRFDAVEEILEPLLSAGPGAERDEALVVLAARDNRQGNHAMALARLEPLEGKLLTQEARDHYAREQILAALALRRWRLAIDSMVDWMSQEGGSGLENQSWVKDAVVKVPARALSRLLSDWNQGEAADEKARKWLQRVIVEHLTNVALSTRDPVLSRDLLARSPPWLRASKSGEQLALLAALAQQEARVTGRAVGVVLGGKTEEQKRRAVRVAAGIVAGLSSGNSSADGPAVRFLAAENRGSLRAALSTLSGLGASVLVAGTDPISAEVALSFAESKEVPVVVMSEPRARLRSLRYGFVAGVSETTQLVALESASRKVQTWRFIGTLEMPCGGGMTAGNAFPFSEWREEEIQGLGILGGTRCVDRVLRALDTSQWDPFVAIGLEAARGPFPARSEVSYLSTGKYPETVSFQDDGLSEAEKRIANGQAPPPPDPFDWFFTLGFDVATLIRQALLNLPETQVTEKDAVRARHKQARKELEKARASLRSTHSQGFSSNHWLDRHFILVRASAVSSATAVESP